MSQRCWLKLTKDLCYCNPKITKVNCASSSDARTNMYSHTCVVIYCTNSRSLLPWWWRSCGSLTFILSWILTEVHIWLYPRHYPALRIVFISVLTKYIHFQIQAECIYTVEVHVFRPRINPHSLAAANIVHIQGHRVPTKGDVMMTKVEELWWDAGKGPVKQLGNVTAISPEWLARTQSE